MTYDEKARELMPLVTYCAKRAAYKYRNLMSEEDAVSKAGEVLTDVLNMMNTSDEGQVRAYLRVAVRNGIINEIRVLRGEKGSKKSLGICRTVSATAEGEDGGSLLPTLRDPSASDPAKQAEQNELIVLGRYSELLPAPAAVRAKAAALQLAIMDAVPQEQLVKIMKKLAKKAEAGDVSAAKVVLGQIRGTK